MFSLTLCRARSNQQNLIYQDGNVRFVIKNDVVIHLFFVLVFFIAFSGKGDGETNVDVTYASSVDVNRHNSKSTRTSTHHTSVLPEIRFKPDKVFFSAHLVLQLVPFLFQEGTNNDDVTHTVPLFAPEQTQQYV